MEVMMNVLVSGSSGLIGSALVTFLQSGEHGVTRLVRSKSTRYEKQVLWDPLAGSLDVEGLRGIDAVVHLAGENIAAGTWTTARKANIRDSRIKGTRLLSESLASLRQPPAVLASASAVGYYGDQGDKILDEQSDSGSGFLADVCRQWEEATKPAAEAGIRVVHLRTGMVLSSSGGVLAKTLTLFRLGMGGRLGSGRQYTSWITLDDVVGAIHHCLVNESLHGAINLVSPNPVTNREFTKVLGKVLKRPTWFAVPTAALRLTLGKMADELLLTSTRVTPTRLLASGYEFHHPELEPALRHELGKTQQS
jgi:uncharacterized protein (TIGR01777 family)